MPLFSRPDLRPASGSNHESRHPSQVQQRGVPGPVLGLLVPHPLDPDQQGKVKWTDGEEYPLIKVDISSHSHPFYTGKHKIMDTGGRVDKFRRRYAKS